MRASNDTPAATEQQPLRSRARRRFLAGVVTAGLLGSLLAGGVSLYAQAQPGPGWWFRGGHGPGSHFRHAAHDPEMMRARLEFATDWILSRIEASDEQRQRVQTIVQATAREFTPVRDQHHQNRQALLQALAQPTINRTTLEAIRHAELQLAETASERLVTALADVAEVLTPEQRARLVELTGRWHH